MKPRIGVLTGGGDCPGLNAAIAGVVRSASDEFEVIAFKKGLEGLLKDGEYFAITPQYVDGISYLGGTVLESASKGRFSAKVAGGDSNALDPVVINEVKENMAELGVEAVIVIGGDGTLSSALQLQNAGINMVGIPKTIDNDLEATDLTIGFSTPINVITDSLQRIHTTAHSHGRVFIVETMGRNAGWLALYGGIAGDSDVVLIPEITPNIEKVVQKLREKKNSGKNYAIVTVAEGVTLKNEQQSIAATQEMGENILGGIATVIAKKIEQLAPEEFEIRTERLGHLQRGGAPTAEDVILGFRLADAAVQSIKNKKFGVMACVRGEDVVTVPLEEAVGQVHKVEIDHPLVNMAKNQGISFGD